MLNIYNIHIYNTESNGINIWLLIILKKIIGKLLLIFIFFLPKREKRTVFMNDTLSNVTEQNLSYNKIEQFWKEIK